MSAGERGHTLFDTPIGAVGIAWSERGVLAVQLPERDRAATRSRLAERSASEAGRPPSFVAAAIEQLRALLDGESADLRGVPLDAERVPRFHGQVYGALRQVPAGATCTYRELATAAGSPAAARAVGQAMRRNPWPLIVPCHRVLASGDRLGGFSAHGGVQLKAKLLRAELRTAQAAKRRRAGGLDFDSRAALDHLRAADPVLGGLIDRVPFTLRREPLASTFEALLRSIVYQQLTGKAAATIHGRVLDLLPARRADPAALLKVPAAKLRAAGLSNAKVAAALDLARRSVAGELPDPARLEAMDEEAIVESLTRVRGIGRWSVEMLLMFRLGRADVMPVGDFGVRQGFQRLYGMRTMPSERTLERRTRAWAPYRSVGAWYMWRAVDEARAAGR